MKLVVNRSKEAWISNMWLEQGFIPRNLLPVPSILAQLHHTVEAGQFRHGMWLDVNPQPLPSQEDESKWVSRTVTRQTARMPCLATSGCLAIVA
jgi:hypothetical protein